MTQESEIEEICARIAQLVRDAYKRGETDAIERLMRAARSEEDEAPAVAPIAPAVPSANSQRKRRAPKGSVGAFVDRVLATSDGPTVAEIQRSASNEIESMIAAGSIRAHLRTGRDAGQYRERYGRWYLVGREGQKSIETADPGGGQAVSGLWSNQEDQR